MAMLHSYQAQCYMLFIIMLHIYLISTQIALSEMSDLARNCGDLNARVEAIYRSTIASWQLEYVRTRTWRIGLNAVMSHTHTHTHTHALVHTCSCIRTSMHTFIYAEQYASYIPRPKFMRACVCVCMCQVHL